MRRRDALALCAATLLAPACAALRRGEAKAADAYLRDLHAQGVFQGAVVFGRRGAVDYEGGFGLANAEAGAPFSVDTPSDGGSIAKTFTAAAVMKLAARGRVDLDAPVQRYVTSFPHAETRVRHLLLHSAGLPGYDWFDRHLGPPAVRSNADQVALLRAHGVAPAFRPGTRFAYDNAAYDVAALVIEAASGDSYEAYVRREFLDPLEMRSAFLRPARLADYPGVRTIGYRGAGPDAARFDAFEGEAFHGGDNLYFSARDLYRWAAAWAAGREGLDARTRAQGLEFGRLDDGTPTRLTLLNWYARGPQRYYVGHHNGFYCFAGWDSSSGVAVGMVTNSGLAATHGAALPRALVALAEGAEFREAPLPVTTEPAPEAMSGAWTVDGVEPFSIRIEGRARYLKLASGLELRMFRQGPGVYVVPGMDAWLRFEGPAPAPRLTWDAVFARSRGARLGR